MMLNTQTYIEFSVDSTMMKVKSQRLESLLNILTGQWSLELNKLGPLDKSQIDLSPHVDIVYL